MANNTLVTETKFYSSWFCYIIVLLFGPTESQKRKLNNDTKRAITHSQGKAFLPSRRSHLIAKGSSPTPIFQPQPERTQQPPTGHHPPVDKLGWFRTAESWLSSRQQRCGGANRFFLSVVAVPPHRVPPRTELGPTGEVGAYLGEDHFQQAAACAAVRYEEWGIHQWWQITDFDGVSLALSIWFGNAFCLGLSCHLVIKDVCDDLTISLDHFSSRRHQIPVGLIKFVVSCLYQFSYMLRWTFWFKEILYWFWNDERGTGFNEEITCTS